ncbi:MAG: ankyrin repeat domain-containing protein [Clostridia bacterium]|nr:ankyrin repeat domain-containing protein [Clostridia bacterium]
MKKAFVMIFILFIAVSLVIITAFYVPLLKNVYDADKLVKAIKAENVTEVKSLLEKNPTCVNTYPTLVPGWAQMRYQFYPLTEACDTGNLEIVILLVEAGANVNENKWHTPLSILYVEKPNNWYEISTYLISKGASLDYSVKSDFSDGVLADIVTCRLGEYHEYGEADLNQIEAAFYYALEHCDHSQVEWERVMQNSVVYDRVGITEYLLKNGYCDVNSAILGTMTPLMFAARDSTAEVVELLLAYGADKTATDKDGKTAYDYAIEQGYTDLAKLIKP